MQNSGARAGTWGVAVAPDQLGWIYQPHSDLLQPFSEPMPELTGLSDQLIWRMTEETKPTSHNIRRAAFWVIVGGGGAGCVLGYGSDVGLFILVGALVLAAAAAVVVLAMPMIAGRVTLRALHAYVHRRHVRRLGRWEARRHRHYLAQFAALAGTPEWYPATLAADAGRIYVVGGTRIGWYALVAMLGLSSLRHRPPVVVIDMSGRHCADGLLTLAAADGLHCVTYELPQQLEQIDVLAGLDRVEIVEAMLASLDRPSSRLATESRVLQELCARLGPEISLVRLAEGLRAMLNEPPVSNALTVAERASIAATFSADYLASIRPSIQQLEAMIHRIGIPVTGSATGRGSELLHLRMPPYDSSDNLSLVANLLLAGGSRWIAGARTVVLAGAGGLPVDRLTAVQRRLEENGIRLVLMFERFDPVAARTVGDGAVCFMRLPTAADAELAASTIGRAHFEVPVQSTESFGTGVERSQGAPYPSEPLWALLLGSTRPPRIETANVGSSETASTSVTVSRVHEYRVEPRRFQDLPATTVLLVESTRHGPSVRVVECAPALHVAA
ncbi:hypothetical protein [Micromonospora marina]|uniref:hypothetical protein n=1 Tax=Micromonospora marina TaxID=307120 RepID=UPI0034527B97